MKPLNGKILLFSFLLLLSILSGVLMSGASLIGRLGMRYIHTEYSFLRTWWKASAAVLCTWIVFYAVQYWLSKSLNKRGSLLVHVTAILLAIIGLLLTYLDFKNTVSHRWLGSRFHTGAYLFWLGWIGISLFLLWPLVKKDTGGQRPGLTDSYRP